MDLNDLFTDPAHPGWGPPPFPSWLSDWRDVQKEAIKEAVAAFEYGAKVVMIQAPTGAGKSAIADGIRRILQRKMMYVATTRQLQDQLTSADNGFPYAAKIKGRTNYPTLDYPQLFPPGPDHVDCGDCDREEGECSYCADVDMCPYAVARDHALYADFSCANTAYLLTEANTAGRFSGQELVCADEADHLEDELIRAVSVSLSPRMLRQLKLTMPKKTVQADWVRWINADAIPAVKKRLKMYPKRVTDPAVRRERNGLEGLLGRLADVAGQIGGGGWIMDGYKAGHVNFRPVTGRRVGAEWLWKHADRWLLMSATILDPAAMLRDLGWPEVDNRGSWHLVDCPSTFAPETRQVREAPVANMGRTYKEESWPRMAGAIETILCWHPFERILVHSHSYELAELIMGRLASSTTSGLVRNRAVTFRGADQKTAAIAEYRKHPRGVLVGPGLERGFDSPETGVICTAKLPYPSLVDKAVEKRLHSSMDGQHWYNLTTLKTLVQSTGRATRSQQDSSVTYLLDAAWVGNKGLKSRVGSFIPRWWREALIEDGDWAYRLTHNR